MPRQRFRRLALLPAPLAVMVFAWACEPGPAAESPAATRPATQPTSAGATSGEQLEHARRPITYFNEKCGRCHGNYGSYWIEGVIAGLGEQKLRLVVDEMALGPAQAPLEGLALEVQIAYHRSLADERPFATVFRDAEGYAGEVTPESRIVLVTPDGEREAAVQGHQWTSAVREATSVRIFRDGKTSEVTLPASGNPGGGEVLHSHARQVRPE